MTLALWISSNDISLHLHLHFPTRTDPLRLNCIVLGSELQNMSFLSGVKGSLADLDGGVACIVLS